MTHSEIFWGWLVKQFAILGAVSIVHWIALALVTVLFGVMVVWLMRR